MKLLTFKNREEFSKVNHLAFNRKYSARADLMESMNTFGFTQPILLIKTDVIDGKMRTFVADGQHRVESALHIGIVIKAVLLDIKFTSKEEVVNFVASLNAKQKPWSLSDYVDAYAFLNYNEYITLNKVVNSSPYSISAIGSMLFGFRSRGYYAKHLRNGTFKCNLLNETLETLAFAGQLSKIGKLSVRMIQALHYVMHTSKAFDKDKFTLKYQEQYDSVKELGLDDYTDVFTSWL